MSKSFADRLKFEITPGGGKISMASTNLQSSINGYCVLQSKILNHQSIVYFLSHLCADLIIGYNTLTTL